MLVKMVRRHYAHFVYVDPKKQAAPKCCRFPLGCSPQAGVGPLVSEYTECCKATG